MIMFIFVESFLARRERWADMLLLHSSRSLEKKKHYEEFINSTMKANRRVWDTHLRISQFFFDLAKTCKIGICRYRGPSPCPATLSGWCPTSTEPLQGLHQQLDQQPPPLFQCNIMKRTSYTVHLPPLPRSSSTTASAATQSPTSSHRWCGRTRQPYLHSFYFA